MSDFLKTIVAHVEAKLQKDKKNTPLAKMRRLAEAPRTTRSLSEALGKKPVAIIAEVKRASPSKGDFALNLNPETLAEAYEVGGASALSVLTEEKFFKGSLSDMKRARKACTLPVLRKEFIIDPYQIYEAAAVGADALLLIARMLDREKLRAFMQLAEELGMETLVEIFDEDDAKTIAPLTPELVGINNRNLKSFHTDPKRAVHMAKSLAPETVVVAASGIASSSDIQAHLEAGISNFLVGESLVRAKDPAALLRTFMAKGEKAI